MIIPVNVTMPHMAAFSLFSQITIVYECSNFPFSCRAGGESFYCSAFPWKRRKIQLLVFFIVIVPELINPPTHTLE